MHNRKEGERCFLLKSFLVLSIFFLHSLLLALWLFLFHLKKCFCGLLQGKESFRALHKKNDLNIVKYPPLKSAFLDICPQHTIDIPPNSPGDSDDTNNFKLKEPKWRSLLAAITAMTPTLNTNTGQRPSLRDRFFDWEVSFSLFSASISWLNISPKVFVLSRRDSNVLTYSDNILRCEAKARILPNAGHRAPARSAQTVNREDSLLCISSKDNWSRAFSISSVSLAWPVSWALSQAWSAKVCVFCEKEKATKSFFKIFQTFVISVK